MADTQGSWQVNGESLIFLIDGNSKATIQGAGITDAIFGACRTSFKSDDLNEYLNVTKVQDDSASGVITLNRKFFDNGEVTLELASGASYYLALSNDATGGTSYGYETLSATWKIENGTASYYAAGTSQGWSLSGNSMAVNYTAENQNSVLAAITGFNTDITDNSVMKERVTVTEWSAGNSGIIQLKPLAFASRNGTLQLVQGSGSYSLSLAAEVVKFDAGSTVSGYSPSVTVDTENASASIVRLQTKGWSLASASEAVYSEDVTKILAKISGLSGTASTDNISFTVNTQSNGTLSTTVQMAFGSLSDTVANIEDADTADSYTFAFSLSGNVTKPGEYFVNPALSSVEEGSASIIGTKYAGWSLSTGTGGNSFINYTAASQSTLATITGLSTGATIETSPNISLSGLPANSGSTATIGVVLQTGALSTLSTTPATVTDNYETDGFTFKFFLSDDVSEPGKYFVNPELKFPETANGSASIIGTKTAGWSLSTTFDKVYYTASSQSILAKITGLSTVATISSDSNVFLSGLPTGSGSQATISVDVAESALAKIEDTPATVTDNYTTDGFTFKFGFSGSVSTPGDQYGDAFLNIASVEGGATSMATVERTLTDGWSVSSTNTFINYTAASTAILAEIKGLSTTVKSTDTPNISLSGTTATGLSSGNIQIILQKAALISASGTPVILTDKIASDSFTFALATSGVSTPANTYADLKLASVENGSASITGSKYEGWNVLNNGLSVVYTPKIESILAKITGLSTGAKINDTANISLMGSDSTIVQLQKGALSFAESIPVSLTPESVASGINFSLSFGGEGISAPADYIADTPALSSIANGSASIMGTKSEGWTLAGLSVTYAAPKYSILGTITGLSMGASAENVALIGGGSTIIQLKDGSLSQAGITLNGEAANTYGFSLSFGVTGKNADGSVGFEPIYYWEKAKGNTTAYYKSDKAEGWVLADSHSVTYTGRYTPTIAGQTPGLNVATITNLNSSISSIEGAIEGISIVTVGDTPRIVLSKDVLATSDQAYTITLTRGLSFAGGSSTDTVTVDNSLYGLSLAYTGSGSVPQELVETTAWTKLGLTSQYSSISAAYWELKGGNNHTQIQYTPQVNGEVLAEVQGLNKDVTAEDLNVITVSGGSDIIQLYKNALAEGDVSLTTGIENYSLSLFRSTSSLNQKRVVAPELSNEAWVVTGTTAKYTAKVTEGYEVANDEKSIIYAASGANVALATITGLAGGLSVSPNKQWIGINNSGTTSKGLQFGTGDTAKVITLKNDVLTNSNVALTTTSVGRNYSLSLGTDVLNESGASASTGVNVWRLNGTTAEYKKVLYAHYSLSTTGDKITYTPEADAAGGLSVKVTGLKSGLAVAADGSHIGVATVTGGVSSITEALKLNGSKDKQIDLTGEVLGTTNVSLSGTGYTFSLTGADTLKPAMQDDSLKWSVNSTTAELRGIKSAGYSVASDSQSINYIAQDSNYLLAGVSGLKSGLATNNGKITGISLSGTDKTITLDNRVLGQSSVTLVNKELADYKLLLDTTTAGTSVATAAADITAWYTTKDTATSTSAAVLKNAKEAHFTLAGDSLYVTYNPRVDGTEIAKITGLKDTLTAANDKIAGIDLIEAVGNSYTISESVLKNATNANVNVSDTNYTFKLADTATPKEKGSRYWAVNGTTANYQYNTTAGYTQASLNGNITYQAERTNSNPNIIASITGIKNGIASTKIGNYIDVVGLSGASTMFKLGSEVLGTESIAIATGSAAVSGADYTIVLKDPDKYGVKENQLGWQPNGDSLALISFREAGFSSAGSSTKLDYYELSRGASIASVSGLKTKPTINTTTLQIAGISINNTNPANPFAVLESGVLNSKDVTITDYDSGDGKLASLSLAKTVDAPKYTMTWSVKSGTATLKEALVAGYSAVEDTTNGNYIKYSPKDNVTTTITGLSSGAKASDNKWSVAGISLMLNKDDPTTIISQSSAVYNIPREGTFVIADSVLTTKDLVLNSGASYGLSLANTEKYLNTGEHGNFKETWKKDANSTKATYVNQTDTEGYVGAGESGKYTIKYYKAGDSDVLATLTGLNKDITAEELIQDGIVSVSAAVIGGSGGYSDHRTITINSKAVLTNTNLTVGANDKFILALGDDSNWSNGGKSTTEKDAFAVHDAIASYVYSKGTVTVQAGKTEGWRINTITPKGSTSSVKDPKTIVYEKAAPLTIATVTGLKSNLTDSVVNAGFAITDWNRGSESAGTGLIKLSNSVLNEKDVKITVPTKLSDGTTGTYGFSFALDTDIIAPVQGENKWVASATQAKKGTLYYQYTTAAGYSLASISSTTLKYSKDTDTVLATITGLKNLGTSPISQTELTGIAVTQAYSASVGSTSAVTGIITLSDSNKLGTSVKVTNGKGEYVFNIADDIEVKDQDPKWFLSGTTGTYRQYSTAGWKLNGTSTTATYQKETGGDTLVTVKGLKKGLTADKLNDEITGLVVNTSDSGVGTIKLTSDFEGTTTISLTDGKYTPAGASQPIEPKYTFTGYTAIDAGKPYWAYKKGTATLKEDAGTGFIPDSASAAKKLTYKKGTTYTLATITGLAGNLKFDETYTADTLPTKGAIYSGASASSGSVVSLNQSTGYITLGKDALTNKKVTLKNGKDYKDDTPKYMLELGSGIRETVQTATEWVLNGSTGTYKEYNPSYYIVGSNSTVIEYKKPTAGKTYATITGLNKNTATADLLNANWEGDATGGVLTVTKDMLGTATVKMAAKTATTENRDTFTLALGKDVDGTFASSLNVNSSATANNGKAKITGRFTQGFYLENGNKTLTYTSAKNATKDVTVATVTGITGSVSVNDGIISLNAGNLNKKNVTVVTSKGNVDYKLVYDGDLPELKLATGNDEKLPFKNLKEVDGGGHIDPTSWTNPKGTGTLKGYITEAGYTMAGSSTSITYTAATTATKKVNVIQEDGSKQPKDIYKSTAKLATIKGLQSNAEITHIETEGEFSIELSGSNTNGNLSIDAGVYNVNVSDYSGKTITGSAKADNIKVDGNSLTVTGGKGDDFIDLGNANSNTFVYSNGDGNDVIANFAVGQDKLQIKSGTIAIKEVKNGDEDIVVKVGTGSITLQGLENITDVNEITIYNAKNVATTYAVPHASTDETTNENVLLADNNYRMDAAQLSDIIKPAAAQYTPYDFTADFSLTKEEKFTPEITYTDKK